MEFRANFVSDFYFDASLINLSFGVFCICYIYILNE